MSSLAAQRSPLLLLLSCIFSQSLHAAAGVDIHLYDLVYISGTHALLGEIAELNGIPDAVKNLSTAQIGFALKPGESRIITEDEVRQALPGDVEISFTGAPAVDIRPVGMAGGLGDFLPVIQRRLARLCGDSLTGVIEKGNHQADVEVAKTLPWQGQIVSPLMLVPGGQIVIMEYRDNTNGIRRIHLSVQVKLYARLSYAARHIRRGEIIRPEDLLERTIDLSSTGVSGWVYQASRLAGWEASRHISPGNPLRWDQVKPPTAVRKGEAVELLLGQEDFQIRVNATALENGSAGDEIWVRVENGGKRLRARVIESGSVKLE